MGCDLYGPTEDALRVRPHLVDKSAVPANLGRATQEDYVPDTLRLPSDADVKEFMPDMTPEQVRLAGERLLESADKLRVLIERIEKSSNVTEDDMKVTYC